MAAAARGGGYSSGASGSLPHEAGVLSSDRPAQRSKKWAARVLSKGGSRVKRNKKAIDGMEGRSRMAAAWPDRIRLRSAVPEKWM